LTSWSLVLLAPVLVPVSVLALALLARVPVLWLVLQIDQQEPLRLLVLVLVLWLAQQINLQVPLLLLVLVLLVLLVVVAQVLLLL
jgi:hypothetical protein